MGPEGILFAAITLYGDHQHLEWVCPDCRSRGSVGGNQPRFHRFKCMGTGREFLPIGLESDPVASNSEIAERTGMTERYVRNLRGEDPSAGYK
jgi:hypothetical protein